MTDEELSGLESELSSEENSIEIQDSGALRLDTPETVAVPKKQLFYQGEEDSIHNLPTVVSPIRKRVRFNRQQNSEFDSEGDSPLHPWEFKRVIRREFKHKLPNNYQIKRWKRPSKVMVDSVVQLLETNAESALQQVLEKYSAQLQNIDPHRPVDKVFRQKQSIMNDIISKIKTQLKKSRFPARISDRDLEIEYIVSKRKFIQKRYAGELSNAERLEGELLREQKLLDEVRQSCETVKENNRTRLTEGLIGNNLHPTLNKAMENAYGLITNSSKDRSMSQFERDIADFNLKTPTENIQSGTLPDDHKTINLLPALQECRRISRELQQNITRFESPQLKLINDELLSRKPEK